MKACEVVRLFVNKAIVPAEPKRRENPGYGRVKALRILVQARLKGLDNDTRVIEHLKKRPWIAKTLGIATVPYHKSRTFNNSSCVAVLRKTSMLFSSPLKDAFPYSVNS